MTEATQINDGRRVYSKTDLAREFQLDWDTVRQRLDGVPTTGKVRGGGGGYLIMDAAPALCNAGIPDARDPELMQPRERKDYYDGSLKRIAYQRERRTLIPSAEVEAGVSALLKLLVQGIDTMPDKLERHGDISPEQLRAAEEAMDSLREDLYQEIKDMFSSWRIEAACG